MYAFSYEDANMNFTYDGDGGKGCRPNWALGLVKEGGDGPRE
jgi:hypothetical protein